MSDIVRYATDHGEVTLSPSIIRQYLVSGSGNVSDQEVEMFLQLCRYQGLNPFLRDAYLIKYGNSPATVVVGKDVHMKRAAKHPDFAGLQAGVVIKADQGIERREGSLVLDDEVLVGGWAKVLRKNLVEPIFAEVALSEYDQKQALWNSKKGTMIRKVALAHALREAFPEDLQGLYAQEEMPVGEAKQLPDAPIIIDMPAEDTPKPTTISPAQAKRMFALADGNNDVVKEAIGKHGYEKTSDILKVHYKDICADIESAAKPEPDHPEPAPEVVAEDVCPTCDGLGVMDTGEECGWCKK